MKVHADEIRREVQFEVGEKVYLKAQPFRVKSQTQRPNETLSPLVLSHF